ncbi:unnamed protein product [Danaus chrysippus]|uniref:(African queen) hypothetical protein n=1 Tax=Danaus chrysippus TaxID=151541 RepID=A0A8J2R804_9NEOP|nr:unnamed protein product [Danaus chrysippus]
MQEHWWSLYILAIFMIGLESKLVGQAFQPKFAEPITNLTVPVGRDATFRCLVHNLGGYRVGWVKADTKAIQAIHDHVITNNPRVGVSHNGQTVWNLHIRNVQEYDRGHYMCQINTDPMQSQMGYLEVVIPPDFVAEETSSETVVAEGGTARIVCRARGQPTPRIIWRREDGLDIVIRSANGAKKKATIHEDEVLTFTKISRSDMGAYLCIASNGVPPSVSKRIVVQVLFHPEIQIPNQIVGAPLGTDVTLECYVESSPRSINYWIKDTNEMVISSEKFEVMNTVISSFESRMTLTVRKLTADDVGVYRCIAKNSLGEVDSSIRLYEIPGRVVESTSSSAKNEDYKYSSPIEGPDNQFGSAERSDDEDDKDNINETLRSHPAKKYPSNKENSTNNKSRVINGTDKTRKNLSNNVRKIFDNLETEARDAVVNSSSYSNSHIHIILTIFSVMKYITY